MNSRHIIEEARFEIAFSTEDEAFFQQESLSALVNGSLLTEINNVFDECSDQQMVIRVDELEIDLGSVPYHNYQGEMVERLRSRLREQLRDRLRGLKSGPRTNDHGEIHRLEQRSRELEIVCCYLQNGHLPWYDRSGNVAEVRALFMRVAESHCRSLVSWLSSAVDRDAALFRLAAILPVDGLLMIARQLLVRRFDAIQSLIESLTNYHFTHGWLEKIGRENRTSCRRDLWRGVITIMLNNKGRFQNSDEIAEIFIVRCSGTNRLLLQALRKFISERMMGENRSGLANEMGVVSRHDEKWPDSYGIKLTLLISALEKRDLHNLQVVWGELLAGDPQITAGILSDITLSPGCRHSVVDQFSESMLYQWLGAVNSDHVDQIKQSYSLFIRIAAAKGISEARAYHDFWDFTLRYSLSDAGLQSDAVRYLVVLMNELRYGGKDAAGIIGSLDADDQMRVLYDELAQQQDRSDSVELGDKNRISAASLSQWFESGDRKKLAKVVAQWSYLLERHASLLDRLLKRHGGTSVIRRLFVQELSSDRLGELVDVIAPGEREFVDGVLTLFISEQQSSEFPEAATPAGSREQSTSCDERDLWGYTFDFLFVECGSRFNKKEYCASVLRKIAAHNNCPYRELLEDMHQWLSSFSRQNRYADELLSIIDELGDLSQPKYDDEKGHPLHPSAEQLIGVMNKIPGSAHSDASWQIYRQFYRRNLAQGQYMSSKIFVRLLADDLMVQAEGERMVHYARIISRLRQDDEGSRAITGQVVTALSEVMGTAIDKGGADGEIDNTPGAQAIEFLNEDAVVYVNNAGLVLLAPYLPVLFERLGFTDRGLFIDRDASERAVHVLQYMADGVSGAPEYMMVLNKLICGVESARPVTRTISLTDSEKGTVDGLLTAAIENWKSVGNTSVDGLRESFLRRDGRLLRKDGQWQLLVESRSYDMLLDQLPWSYSTIKYAWMPQVLHVEWR